MRIFEIVVGCSTIIGCIISIISLIVVSQIKKLVKQNYKISGDYNRSQNANINGDNEGDVSQTIG